METDLKDADMSLIKEINYYDEKWLEQPKKLLHSSLKTKTNDNILRNDLTKEDFEKWRESKADELKAVREWMLKQPHLPQLTSDFQVLNFLHSCNDSIEQTKIKIENYFTIRTHAQELFTDRRLCSKHLQQAIKMTRIAPLPSATPEGYNAIFIDCADPDLAHYNFVGCMKLAGAVMDVLVKLYPREDGNIVVFDMKNSVVAHIVKTNLTALKKVMTYVQSSLPFRLKQIHVVNASPLVQHFENILKPFIKPELKQLIHIHMKTSMDTFHKFIPQKNLPKDYGGEADSLKCLNDQMLDLLASHETWLEDMEKLVVDENKRRGRSKTAGDVFGVEGSFRKLELD